MQVRHEYWKNWIEAFWTDGREKTLDQDIEVLRQKCCVEDETTKNWNNSIKSQKKTKANKTQGIKKIFRVRRKNEKWKKR